ncbi:MAG: hypothetical protein HY645_06430 [Acidobacteria bacterium]|nr:hypothetical protein [Acidobacteriota bacterium]
MTPATYNRSRLPLSWLLFLFFPLGGSLGAAPVDAVSCSNLMAPKRQVGEKWVGQEECLMTEVSFTQSGKSYRRFDIGLSGTLEGWVVKEGTRVFHFTSFPEFLFDQLGNKNPRFHGILRYEAEKGTSMTLVYPEGNWNGKLFVTVHGSGGSFKQGTLKPWDKNLDPQRPLGDLSRYETGFLDKGYAVLKTHRNADMRHPGDYEVVLDDGQKLGDRNLDQHPELLLDMILMAENLLKERLGKDPSRTYWYGHSGGVMVGRPINYKPALNRDPNGNQIIDGFLFDDPGGGLWIPILLKDGKNVLFTSDSDRRAFVKTIEVAHQNYPNVYTDPLLMDVSHIPEYVSPVYLANKRRTASVMREKKMEDKYRMYEVRGVSHSGGEDLEKGKKGDIEILNLPRFISAMADVLDAWVEKGIEPPPTKSDVPTLGDADNNGLIENPAVAMPEVACPLGVYFPYPPSMKGEGAGTTSFAPFDGTTQEPLDGRGQFVDMNGNGKRDKRETVSEAWRRLGLLKEGERIDVTKYSRCVEASALSLKQQRFLNDAEAKAYIKEAASVKFPSQ